MAQSMDGHSSLRSNSVSVFATGKLLDFLERLRENFPLVSCRLTADVSLSKASRPQSSSGSYLITVFLLLSLRRNPCHNASFLLAFT